MTEGTHNQRVAPVESSGQCVFKLEGVREGISIFFVTLMQRMIKKRARQISKMANFANLKPLTKYNYALAIRFSTQHGVIADCNAKLRTI